MNQTGTLFIVATPIGNYADMSPRAIDTLKQVDVILAEDTRHSGRLLQHFGIKSKLLALHEHNEKQIFPKILIRLQQGQNLALISDAGTPLISDPGFYLTRALHREGIRISPVPGPCALIAALSAAGMPTDRFCFEGFVPAKSSARKKYLSGMKNESRTLVFYESPHRIEASITDMIHVFGAERQAVFIREISKTFETIKSATLAQVQQLITTDNYQQKGEMVIIVAGADKAPELTTNQQLPAEAQQILRVLLAELGLKQAVALTVKITGLKRRLIYQTALQLQSDERE